jgi:hypothetical protein
MNGWFDIREAQRRQDETAERMKKIEVRTASSSQIRMAKDKERAIAANDWALAASLGMTHREFFERRHRFLECVRNADPQDPERIRLMKEYPNLVGTAGERHES